MKACVLVLTERLDGLARTSRDLDAQALSFADFGATFLAGDLTADDLERLDDLVSRRPNRSVVRVPDDSDWSSAVRSAIDTAKAEYVIAVTIGDGFLPEALPRLLTLAESGNDVVIARQAGRPVWLERSDAGPVAAAVVSSRLAASVLPGALPTATDWLDAWHTAVLAEGTSVAVLEDYPALRPSPDVVPADRVEVFNAEAAWEGSQLRVRAIVGTTTPKVDPTLVLRGPDNREYALPTQREGREGTVRLTGEIDIERAALGAPLPDGEWTVGVVATQPGFLAEGVLPKSPLKAGLVHGRPVVPTLRGDKLRLQIGAVRRNYLKADPTKAHIVESARGTALNLPLEDLHVAETSAVPGALLLGRLKIPATVEVVDGNPQLHAWLSGLAGRYPLSVAFGHDRPVSMDLALVVDGVGQMHLERTPKKGVGTPRTTQPPQPSSARKKGLVRVREALPAPLVGGLSRVPGLKRWYAAKAR